MGCSRILFKRQSCFGNWFRHCKMHIKLGLSILLYSHHCKHHIKLRLYIYIYTYIYNISHDVPMKLYRQYLRWFLFLYTTQQHPTLVLNGFDVLIHLLKVMLAAGSMSRPDMHGECLEWKARFWMEIQLFNIYIYIYDYICISNGICF